MNEQKTIVKVDRPAEWRAKLAILVSGLLVFETLTGLSIYLLPFSLPNQFVVLVHTLAGLIFNRLGHAPRRWETLRLAEYEITVVDVSGSRITQVRVRRLEEDGAERAEA